MEASTDLIRWVQQPGWDFRVGKDSLMFLAPTEKDAENFLDKWIDYLAAMARQWRLSCAYVGFPGCPWAYDVPARMAANLEQSGESAMTEELDFIKPYLRNADELRVLDFIREKISDGLIVIITSQLDNRCRFTSKSLKPERAFFTPAQFHNYDYVRSWDIDRIGQPSAEYYRLRELLDRDGVVSGYEYKLIRPDGALCSYSTDYYLVDDGWAGEPVRIGISRLEDWKLLQPAS